MSDSSNAEWLSLAEAARQLGLPASATRRLVHDGTLHAELRRGATGPQYYVPRSQFIELQQSTGGPEGSDASGGILLEINRLRNELDEIMQDREERESAMREEIAQLRADIALGIEALHHSSVPSSESPVQKRPPWWRTPNWRRILGI